MKNILIKFQEFHALAHSGRFEFIDLLHYTTRAFCTLTGKDAHQYIKGSYDDGLDLCISLKKLTPSLYFPKSVELRWLYMAILEHFERYTFHQYEIKETIIRPEDIVLDCGAAEGLFSLDAATRCRKCYVVEPHPDFARCLKKTFKGFPHVELLEIGISYQDGFLPFNFDGFTTSVAQSSTGIKVQVRTIDSLFYEQNEPVTYIKADLEGHEMSMLQGATKTISTYRPRMAITTYHKPGDAKAFEEYIKCIEPSYKFRFRGMQNIHGVNEPIMMHAFTE